MTEAEHKPSNAAAEAKTGERHTSRRSNHSNKRLYDNNDKHQLSRFLPFDSIATVKQKKKMTAVQNIILTSDCEVNVTIDVGKRKVQNVTTTPGVTAY